MAVLALAVAALGATGKSTQQWLYYDIDSRGPAQWFSNAVDGGAHTMCNPVNGKKQSPINLHNIVNGDHFLKPLETHYEQVAAADFTVLNNQHTVKVDFHHSPGHFIDRNLGGQKFDAVQFHFHSPSEHGIMGGLYPLELHIVHTTADANAEHQYAVIGIMFDVVSGPNEVLNFWDNLPGLPLKNFEHFTNKDIEFESTTVNPTRALDFRDLLGNQAYYTYSGSFTTPPCTEGVKWYVMKEKASISQAQLDEFRNMAMNLTNEWTEAEANGATLPRFFMNGNNRPVQPLNGRQVYEFSGAVEDVPDHDDTERIAIAGLVIACIAMLLIIAGFVLGGSCLAKGQQPEPVNNEPAGEKI